MHHNQVVQREAVERAKKTAAEREVRARREVEAAEFTKRAVTNLENWKTAFIGDEMASVCYHGHIFDAKTMLYEITCDVGYVGYPPALRVVCNQDRCTHQQIEKTPRGPHDPLDDGLHGHM